MAEHGHIRIVVVDDHVIVRRGLKFSLLAFNDLEVVGEASNGEEALQVCPMVRPDVVLMDLVMPGMDGVTALRALKEAYPHVEVIVLTNFQDGSMVQDALQAGAIGYLLKDVTIEDLVKAIRLARLGQPSLAPAAAQALVRSTQAYRVGFDLTEREREVLALLADGFSNQQIADRLVISLPTVKFHVHRIRTKLGAASRTEAVALAFQHHLVKVH